MAEHRYRSRAEGPIVLPFTPFTQLEALVHAMELSVETRYGVHRVPNGSKLRCDAEHLTKVALTVDLNCEPEALAGATRDGHLEPHQVRFAVIAREPSGGHLRQNDVLWSGRWSDLEGSELRLLDRGAVRPRTLQNWFDGFDVEIVAVMDEQLESRHLMPPRRGTVIARATFGVRPFGRVSGLQPKALTPEIRRAEDVRVSAWLLVKRTSSLHDSPTLEDAVEVYVDEEILRLTALQRDSMRTVAETLFAVPALTQLVFLLAEDLQANDAFEWDGSGSEALSLVYDSVKACGPEMEPAVLIQVLRSAPERVAAIVSGYDQQKDRIIAALRSEEEVADALPGD